MMQKLNHHPDRGGDVAFAQTLNDAVKTLCDPRTRASYDAIFNSQMAIAHDGSNRKSSPPPSSQASKEDVGAPHFSDSNQNETDSDAADCETQAEPENCSETQCSYENATGGTKQANPLHSVSTVRPTVAACLFCNASLRAPDRAYPTEERYASPHRCRCCDGATTPLTQFASANNNDMRRLFRLENTSDAHVWTHWPSENPNEATLYDFSPYGCSFLSAEMFANGHVLLINTDLFNAICKVRHIKKTETSHYMVGLEFLTLDMQILPGALINATA